MIKDPIVEEVRAIREEFARKHNYDVEAIVRALRLASEAHGRSLVSLPPKAPVGEDEAHHVLAEQQHAADGALRRG